MWVASACRVVESQQMRWLPESTGRAADADAVTALRNVAELIERHVRHLPARSAKRGAP